MKPSNLLLTITLFLTLTQVTPLTQHSIKTLTLPAGTQNPLTPDLTPLPQKIPTDLKNLSAKSGIVQISGPVGESQKKQLAAASIDRDSIIGTLTYDQISNILMREIKKVPTSESSANGLDSQHPQIPVSQDQAYGESML
jgi:hypothetical protein